MSWRSLCYFLAARSVESCCSGLGQGGKSALLGHQLCSTLSDRISTPWERERERARRLPERQFEGSPGSSFFFFALLEHMNNVGYSIYVQNTSSFSTHFFIHSFFLSFLPILSFFFICLSHLSVCFVFLSCCLSRLLAFLSSVFCDGLVNTVRFGQRNLKAFHTFWKPLAQLEEVFVVVVLSVVPPVRAEDGWGWLRMAEDGEGVSIGDVPILMQCIVSWLGGTLSRSLWLSTPWQPG